MAKLMSTVFHPWAVLALALFEGAYAAEIFRAGILSVDRGQWEAALSTGLTRWQTYRRVILPQAVRRVLPPLTGVAVSLVKDSSLASTITINELLLKSQQLASSNFMMMEMLTIAALFYLFYTGLFTVLFRRVERRLEAGGYA
jgi:polar amino acid transport system permease protein